MTLSEKIQKLRKERGLSQDQLALELGVSRQSVSKWELGDSTPDIPKILQLADYFQVSTDYLLRDELDLCHIPQEEEPVPPKKNPFHKAFKISLWITIACCILPFAVALLLRLFSPAAGTRLGTNELIFIVAAAFTTIVPAAGVITLIFWILKHTRK